MNEIEFQGKKYQLTFYDDFDGTELDTQKFERCPQWERQAHMQRHGWWSDECSYVKDGNLVIECKQAADGKLISGGVRTKNKDGSKTMFMQAQGLYEIKFKVDEGEGFWWAFWSEGITGENGPFDGSAQDGAEIDFFEILPGPSAWKDENGYSSYLDGKLLWYMDGKTYGNGICNVPGYIKITGEFGEWGGPTDKLILNGGSKFMYVDYVKVYREKK